MSLVRAARVFSYEIPARLPDDTVAGTLWGVNVYVGELRRLTAAIHAVEADTEADPNDPNDQIILDFLKRREMINAIRHRRSITNEYLKEAKEYVDLLGARHNLRYKNLSSGTWEWV